MATVRQLCEAPADTAEVLQGNMAFAVGCVRAGIHAADGYPGTPSTEVIDKGLSQVQDLIKVGWSVNEAVAAGVAIGHTYAGRDAVVTMKIPGLFQACDIFTSIALYPVERGALVFYIASDFTPSSTQHVIDPRYLYKSCFVPVFEPRNHQEMHEAPRIMADISRRFKTAGVVHASGLLCHSEGLVRLAPHAVREPAAVAPLRQLNSLPAQTRKAYDQVMAERMPALTEFVDASPLNMRVHGAGKKGVITCGSGAMYVEEYRRHFEPDLDILSVAFTNPLPMGRIRAFVEEIAANGGEVYVLEDGYRFVQEACLAAGLRVKGKDPFCNITEWSPSKVAAFLGARQEHATSATAPVPRPPMICAGCPYRLIGGQLARLHKRGDIEAIFGDIGCNTLLYFMNALDTGLAMGASESIRTGYVLSKPASVAKCVSLLGDGTECHSGMDATRNAVFRHVAGVKIVLDNHWVAMTGGQPSPASPTNLAGDPSTFSLTEALAAQGAQVMQADAYDLKDIKATLKAALDAASEGAFVVLVVRGTCIRKMPAASYDQVLSVDADKCRKCGSCLICPGIEAGTDGTPEWNNLCTGCVSKRPACAQMCPTGAISFGKRSAAVQDAAPLPDAPDVITLPKAGSFVRPDRLALAIRGVGGQGNLFFGKLLARMAFLAGYGETNILKGETHGMAQMGGPVISTFGCGAVACPDLAPGSADCLIVMEESEVLRPGFIDLLRSDGTVLLADTKIFSQAMKRDEYPGRDAIDAALAGRRCLRIDVLSMALGLGDASGRCANVVMLGALSKLDPFAAIPENVWLAALSDSTPKQNLRPLNFAAFKAGRSLV